jgi:lipid-A-disaccharide synthase
MLSAGEASGDLNASALADWLKKLAPESELFGMGGPKMAAQGVRILKDPTGQSVIGFSEALKALPKMRKLLGQMEAALQEERPDCLVAVDFPGFNMKLARIAHSLGVPVVFYFAPSAWAWGKGRARQVAQTAKLVLCVFPMEEQVYKEAGAPVRYIGHPLAEIVKAQPNPRQILGIGPETRLVALLPGSRPGEVRTLLAELLSAAQLVHAEMPDVQFILSHASSIPLDVLEQQASSLALPVRILSGNTYELLAAADAAVIASGTATLEAALLGTPMVIVYRTSRVTWFLGKLLLKISFIGLPNILAGKRLVPELLQNQANGKSIAREVTKLLRSDNSALRRELNSLKEKLGQGGAARRAAEEIIALVKGGGKSAHSADSQ